MRRKQPPPGAQRIREEREFEGHMSTTLAAGRSPGRAHALGVGTRLVGYFARQVEIQRQRCKGARCDREGSCHDSSMAGLSRVNGTVTLGLSASSVESLPKGRQRAHR